MYTMAENIEIIVGTYEQFLLGYSVESTAKKCKLTRSFATHSHQASVRDIASSKHYLASAGADDSIYLYNMRDRIESGKLTHHNDTVNGIAFTPDSSHILTCSSDGSIGAVRCGNWKLEKHWKSAHKGSPVNCLSIHPTGKLALSLGGDGALRTWNLVKGRQAYATNLVPKLGLDAKNIAIVKWSPDGTKYLIATNYKVILYSVENAGIIDEIASELRVTCVEFLDDNIIIIGHDDGQIKFHNFDGPAQILLQKIHDTRVKAVVSTSDIIATASSSGELKLWKFKKNKLILLGAENCGARITCLIIVKNLVKPEVKQEEIVVQDIEIVTPKRNPLRIRQEVIIEDEDDDEESVTLVKTTKKLKRKSVTETVSSPGGEEPNHPARSKVKKSKTHEKGVLPVGKKKKLRNAVEKPEPKGLKRKNDSEPEISRTAIPFKTLATKKIKKKSKEGDPAPGNTIDRVSPTKKSKSLTTLKPASKITKKKVKKFVQQ
ncbi:p21-activated protein kinase-interacting protein 1-like [Athalia rosae]|uniref:p21-activated protein kinase-interacting protein 1-like n=1 Tax=Athalia rosae TaxID=37344 RepID=UPI00203402E1|nr:p21-activated protein kinase-interacting protein 1-like [Athalia rosae]